jgi:hypothetical protein
MQPSKVFYDPLEAIIFLCLDIILQENTKNLKHKFFCLSFFAACSIVFLVNLACEQKSLATPAWEA